MTKRLSVALDDELLKEVQKLTGARTKKEAIETALRAYVQKKARRAPDPARGPGDRGLGLKAYRGQAGR